MTIFGIYVSRMSGIWIAGGASVAYLVAAFLLWGLCVVAADADRRKDWK